MRRILDTDQQRIIAAEEVWESFKQAKNIVVASPAPCDVDSIYSCLLLDKLFSHLGMGIPRPHQLFCAQKPDARDNALLQFAGEKLNLFSTSLPSVFIKPLYIVGVDYGNFNTLKIVPQGFLDHYFIGLDEHPGPAQDFPENGIQLYNPRMPSTTALIYELFRAKAFPVTKEMATYVTLGIMSDTGRMTNSKANAHAFRIMADCIYKGIPWEKIQEAARPRMTRERIKVWAKVEKNLNFLTPPVVSLVVYKRMLAEWNGSKKDIDTFLGQMILLEGVEMTILIFEQDDGSWKISFRSNNQKNYSATEFAKIFNGGGHYHAAAATYRGDPLDAEKMILSCLQKK